MALYELENEFVRIGVEAHGAELRSLVAKETGREYMWSGDPAYWGRVSPLLFPVVGAYRDGISRYRGQTYRMSQHGFARDMDFMVTEQSKTEIWFCLTDSDETWEKYPFAFSLEAGYRLEGKSVRVLWRVSNPSGEPLYFSIGGHPAFAAPVREPGKCTCYIGLAGADSLIVRGLHNGLASDTLRRIDLEKGGLLPVTEELFAGDALIVEEHQTGRVQLLDADKKPYLTVAFDAPLFGLWTPPGKNAPFICIEPWYGRCDREDFEGELPQREWGNTLEAGESFQASYTITPK